MRPHIKLVFTLFVTLLAGISASAETVEYSRKTAHQFRIGWGDQLFENLIWQEPSYIIKNMPESYTRNYNENFRYSQHWFGEYQYIINEHFGAGFAFDASACIWDEVTRNGLGKETTRSRNRNFWNLTAMPMVHFNWFNSRIVKLYSALGLGIGINGGTETDAFGRHTVCGVAFNIAALGMNLNAKNFFFFTEIGGLASMVNKDTIFMLGSRIISAGVGIRFSKKEQNK